MSSRSNEAHSHVDGRKLIDVALRDGNSLAISRAKFGS